MLLYQHLCSLALKFVGVLIFFSKKKQKMKSADPNIHVTCMPENRARRAQESEDSHVLVNDLHISIEGNVLLEGASLSLHLGRVYGLFGNNGCGKTTLLKCLEDGRIEGFNAQRVHVVRQIESLDDKKWTSGVEYLKANDSRLKEVQKKIECLENKMEDTEVDPEKVSEELSVLYDLEEELQESQDDRAKGVLAKLGFLSKRQATAPCLLSGGWQMRLRLAEALLSECNVFLFDEPTNHLDLMGIEVLKDLIVSEFVNERNVVVVISHNRAFLEDITTDTIMFARKTLRTANCDFATFMAAVKDKEKHQNARFEKQQETIARYQRTIANVQSQLKNQKNSKGNGLISSRKQKLDLIERGAINKHENGKRYKQCSRYGQNWDGKLEPVVLEPPPRISIASPSMAGVGDVLLGIEHGEIGYADRTVFKSVNFNLFKNKIVGILGKNGAGKSSLLKCLTGELQLIKGKRFISNAVKIGTYSQDFIDRLPGDISPAQYLNERFGLKEQDARQALGAVGVTGKTAVSPIDSLSGGQKARVGFCALNCECPHVLILDEPCNHLDLLTIEALVDSIQDFKGSVVLVSHNEYLMRVCDEFYTIDKQSLQRVEE